MPSIFFFIHKYSVYCIAQTVRGAGLSPAQSYILSPKVTLVVSKKYYLEYNVYCLLDLVDQNGALHKSFFW